MLVVPVIPEVFVTAVTGTYADVRAYLAYGHL